jgi:hypothetical protein
MDELISALRGMIETLEEVFNVVNDLFKTCKYVPEVPVPSPDYNKRIYYKNEKKVNRHLPYQQHIFPR